MTHRPIQRTTATLAALALASLLAACGGGGDDSSASAAGGGGTLTLSATTPAAQATTIDLSTATAKSTNGRAADAFSSVPYCEIYWENASGANGKKYAVQVYYRQGDKQPMHVSVGETGGWVVFNNNSGAAIAGITVDTTARTAVFDNKAMTGAAGEAGTLAGTASFGSSTTAACGA